MKKRPSWRNLGFTKTLFLLGKTNDFQLWGPLEINDFPAQNADAKRSAPKLEISSILGPFSDPKLTRKAMRNGACFATLCKLPGNQRKLTGRTTFGLPIWLRKWLGLLDLLLVALIISASFSEGHAEAVLRRYGNHAGRTGNHRGSQLLDYQTGYAND